MIPLRRSLLAALGLFAASAAFPLRADDPPWVPFLRAEAFCIADDSPATEIAFGTVGGGARYLTPANYVRLSYTPPRRAQPNRFRRYTRAGRQLRLFTNNPTWLGGGTQRNGLVHAGFMARIPLFWRAFDAVKPGGAEFGAATAALWTQVRDPHDADWETTKGTALLPTHDHGRTYAYVGADRDGVAADGSYCTALVFELVSPVADTQSPAVTHAPFAAIHDLKRPIMIVCQADEDVDLEEAVLYRRFRGQSAWTQTPFFITDDADNPFLFHLSAEIPAAELAEGVLEYWFTVRDGVGETVWSSAAAPWSVTLAGYAAKELSTDGGVIELIDGNPADGVVSLELPPGALSGPARLRLRRRAFSEVARLPPPRRAPHAAPAPQTGNEWPVIEAFDEARGAAGLAKPAMLTLVYEDADADGLVDGTDYAESEMRVYWWDGFEWRARGGQPDTTLNQVRAPVLSLGTYGLFPASAFGPMTYRPKEKIITPAARDGVNDVAIFDGAGPGAVIKIFDIAGRPVREIRDSDVWDGTDEHRRVVESGVYIFQVSADGKRVNGTITVAK